MRKYVNYIILSLSIICFILFFPVRFSHNQCCLGDVMSIVDVYHSEQHMLMDQDSAHRMLHRYLIPFGLLWWASIGAGYWGIKNLRMREKYDQT